MLLLFALILSVFLVMISAAFYYEILAFTWRFLPKSAKRSNIRILIIVMNSFLGHVFTVFIYGVFYYYALNHFNFGELYNFISDSTTNSFSECLYFSGSTYSSLGYGDLVPTGHIRIIATTQVINGLILISWSASVIYMAMSRAKNIMDK